MEELQKEYTAQEIANLKHRPFDQTINKVGNENIVMTIREHKNVDTPVSTAIPIGSCIYDNTVVQKLDLDPYIKTAPYNEHFGANKPLTIRQVKKMKIQIRNIPPTGSELIATKFRFKDGHLEILVKPTDPKSQYATWIAPHLHPLICMDVTSHLEQNKPRINGSPGQLDRKLFLKGCQYQQ